MSKFSVASISAIGGGAAAAVLWGLKLGAEAICKAYFLLP